MKITEKDLYKFVFYKSELPEEILNFINKNLDKFASSIELLNKIKSQSEMEVSFEIMTRIHDLIDSQYQKEEFILTPINIDNSKEYMILAADSAATEIKNDTITFSDPGNNYLIKVISQETENKLFLFSSKNELSSSVTLTIYPSNESHEIEINNSNYILLKKQLIEKIIIN